MKKLAIVKNKKAFTLLELTVSLFLLIILTLLLMLIIQTTMMTSKRFLDYSNYEYALAHKKILETYNNSAKVYQESNYILMKSKDDVEDVRINFRGGRIYIDKFKDSNNFAGYILVLKNMKSYSLSQENDIIHVSIVDKSDHEREMFLKVKDEKTDKEKEKEKKEKAEKAKEEKENKNKDEEHDHNEHNKEGE
ncbi:type IV pilus minor pilin ComGF family protein [Gemella haemolysans]|uniref:Type IV pilus minor pilin ComGF family protein n=1 Tax=Gemella haemolysans TaxID=1379 RepID=A0AAW6B2Y3_9BACL|nr:type IV pilus minor pilin ComGF family protein [Gemella haemolysans]MDB6185576.1 type IV pilus minor pilin ComGF family protein [Gemella haemolysans]